MRRNISLCLGEKEGGAYKICRSLTPFRHVSNAHCKDCASHCFPILVFVQLPVQIQLKVHQFCRIQSHDDLPLIGRRGNDRLARGDTPFVYSAVGQDVSDALWVNL